MTKAFITFEGGDGAGKSTLIERVNEMLLKNGHSVIQTRAPGATAPGKVMRELILHPPEQPLVPLAELFLYLGDRSQHVEKIIRPALNVGQVVLCDRYNDSTIAYQGGARGFTLEKVEELCHFATGGLQPDLTLYLDLDPKIGLERVKGKKDQIEAEDISFHQKIRDSFHEIGRKDPSRFKIIDATQSKDAVFEEAMHLIDVHCFAKSS